MVEFLLYVDHVQAIVALPLALLFVPVGVGIAYAPTAFRRRESVLRDRRLPPR